MVANLNSLTPVGFRYCQRKRRERDDEDSGQKKICKILNTIIEYEMARKLDTTAL